ncbi:GMC family oxidoreductase [Sinorhizobium sp. BG8]|uniref:FAD-dependent oxidoreductase n=1 Tax=Sinorhizobium sp. BG8 TaxID=2613773 RepID=UPI00193DF64A|nr:GMC family oxidoreductase [Sinorhizobium sp. BG8]QRM57749.1 GMC family oxidoreductase [Sinorhizobium sp. BG8]
MIRRGATVPPGTELECDVLVVGSGPAGTTVALELAGSSIQTILLESGARKESAQSRDLLRGFVTPAGSHEPLEAYRRRQFGGTSNAWGGRCIAFDPVDLEARPWIPHSGWPLPWSELQASYARAATLCEVAKPEFNAETVFPGQQAEMIEGFDGADVITSVLERWGPPTNFAQKYGPLLEKSTNVTVLLNATMTKLRIEPGTRRIKRVEVAIEDSHRFTVRPQRVVLACGGLENARLLLASNDESPAGIGNENDNVGRYYMSHLTGIHSWAKLKDPGQTFRYDFERDNDVYVRRRFWITPDAQRREKIGNVIACFLTPYLDQALEANALASAIFLTKFAIALRRQSSAAEYLRQNKSELMRHVNTMFWRAPTLAPQILQVVKQRYLTKRRLPILLPRKEDLNNRFALYYQSEHMPNPESRVMLRPERDALGTPRLDVRVAFTEMDVKTIVRTHQIIGEQFGKTATGELVVDDAPLEDAVRDQLRHFDSIAHHIGTTRMSDDPKTGVVDRNCRVHDTENLFVAGASVFPTSSHANPTLTIVALALRLVDYLKSTRGG